MLVGVPGCQEGTQPQPAQVDLVTVMQPGVGELAGTGRRRQHLRSHRRRELICAGKEVGMQVGVRRLHLLHLDCKHVGARRIVVMSTPHAAESVARLVLSAMQCADHYLQTAVRNR